MASDVRVMEWGNAFMAIYVTEVSRGIGDISYSAFEFFCFYLRKKNVSWIFEVERGKF